MGSGSEKLIKIQNAPYERKTLGGYFQTRLPNPYAKANINYHDYIVKPHDYNPNVPENISLICGDPILELQSNAISTLANTQIPGTDTWIRVIEWISDLVDLCHQEYDIVFFDMNPSFSIFTQMALASTDRLILPVMADDSSRRALQNAFSLIYGFELPHPIYQDFAFSTKLKKAKKALPKVHQIAKNRLTQYMGAASAFDAVLKTIDTVVDNLINDQDQQNIFSTPQKENLFSLIRDFQTTGIISVAFGAPFFKLEARSYTIQDKKITIRTEYLNSYIEVINNLAKII